MRKRLLAAILTAAICFGMIGCSPDKSVERLGSDSKEKSASSMFVAVEYNDLNGVVCYEKDTKVMYWVSRARYNYVWESYSASESRRFSNGVWGRLL